jgi:mRNA-degrading endonuclease YafQ of YafQ-DinJ toxin-antitoxin module
MYRIGYTTRFKKDFKRCKKRGLDISILENVIEILRLKGKLPDFINLINLQVIILIVGNATCNQIGY